MRALILNRKNEIPADGWYQIEVNGTWPAGKDADGNPRKQLIDEKATASIVNRFQEDKAAAGENFPGLLVDLDHLSHDMENDTSAWAWVQDLAIRNGQLHAKLDLTDLGEPAIRNKRVKFFSTEYEPEDLEQVGDGLVRPLRLAGLAFTNRPNNRGAKPISNRAGDDQPGGEPTPTNDTKPPMKSIAEALGLSADADEAAILAKLTQVISERDDLKAKQAGAEADTVLNRFEGRIPADAKKSWRERLITNRKETEELMDTSFPEKQSGQKRIFNRSESSNPVPVEAEQNGNDEAANKRAAAIRNRASEIQAREGIRFNQAFSRAQAELA